MHQRVHILAKQVIGLGVTEHPSARSIGEHAVAMEIDSIKSPRP